MFKSSKIQCCVVMRRIVSAKLTRHVKGPTDAQTSMPQQTAITSSKNHDRYCRIECGLWAERGSAEWPPKKNERRVELGARHGERA